jgi:hypothetical protein
MSAFRKLQLMLAMVASVLGLCLFAPSTAQASNTSCAWNNPNYGPTPYCNHIEGGGLYVSYVEGWWRGSALVCNPYMKVEFYDNGNRLYDVRWTGTAYGCGTGGNRVVSIYKNVQGGYACSTLFYSNTQGGSIRTTRACGGIG